MTSKLLALLAGLGTVTIGGSVVTLYTPRPGVAAVELLDAGIRQECRPRARACTVYGLGDGGHGYRTVKVRFADCGLPPDGGARELVVLPRHAALWHQLGGLQADCRPLANPGSIDLAQNPEDIPGECACWQPDAGACAYSGPGADAGYNPGAARNHYPAGTWSGPGCRPIACGSLAGIPNRPEGCEID